MAVQRLDAVTSEKMFKPANNPRRRLEMDRVLVLCSHRLRCLVLQAHLG